MKKIKTLFYIFCIPNMLIAQQSMNHSSATAYKSNINTHTSLIQQNDKNPQKSDITTQTIDPVEEANFKTLLTNIKTQNFNQFRAILQKLKDYNLQDSNGNTLLHLCLMSRQYPFIGEILKYPINPNIKNKEGKSPFYITAEIGDSYEINLLLYKGADPNITDSDGDTPLMSAIYRDNESFISTLLATGKVNINAQNKYGLSAIHLAAYMGLNNVINNLVARHANVNIKDNDSITPLHYAVGNGHYLTTQYLISAHVSIDAKDSTGATPLYNAVVEGQTTLISLLIQNGANLLFIDNHKRTLLHSACFYKQVDVLRILLSYRKIDVNLKDVNGNTALMQALISSSKDCVSLLLPVTNLSLNNNNNQTSLMLSIQSRNMDAANKIILENPKLNFGMLDKKGNSLMHYVAQNNATDFLFFLKSHKAPFFAKNLQGNTPLDVAIYRNNGVIVDYYIKNFPSFMKDTVYIENLVNSLIKDEHTYLARKLKKAAYNYNNPIIVQKPTTLKRTSVHSNKKTISVKKRIPTTKSKKTSTVRRYKKSPTYTKRKVLTIGEVKNKGTSPSTTHKKARKTNDANK